MRHTYKLEYRYRQNPPLAYTVYCQPNLKWMIQRIQSICWGDKEAANLEKWKKEGEFSTYSNTQFEFRISRIPDPYAKQRDERKKKQE